MLIDSETLSIDFIGQTKKVYKTFEISSFSMRSPKSLLKYDSFWPQMISSSFSFHFKVFFSKATISWQYKCFLWTSSQTLVANVIAAWKKNSCQLWHKSKSFSFPSKANTVRDKKLHVSWVHQKLFEKSFWSMTFSQQKTPSLHKRLCLVLYDYSWIHKNLFFKNYVSFVGQDTEKSYIFLCLYLQKNERLFPKGGG